MRQGLRQRLLLQIAPGLLWLASSTWRIEEDIPDECREIIAGNEPGVIAFWHGKMLPVWFRFRGRNFGAVVSRSRDGEVLAQYLERLGYRLIRGSSSKGGGDALGEMVMELEHRSCLLTPDGPRGPARQAKAGVLVGAGRARRRVLLVGWSSSRSWKMNSWDHMEIPRPFARVVFRYCIFDDPHTSSPSGQQHGETHRIAEHELAAVAAVLDRLNHQV